MEKNIKRLLSLPPNLVTHFHTIRQADTEDWYCTSDPQDCHLGSGGGTIWLLESCYRQQQHAGVSFDEWLAQEQRILLHAGGQSRRIPAYATGGKILTPIPIFRWERGQKLNQTLLDIQLPFYERVIRKAPNSLHTLVASGDVYIRSTGVIPDVPKADIVCYGLWVEPALARNHGVFLMSHAAPDELDYMLQKPSTDALANRMLTHFFLMDIGVWLLSDKAVAALRRRATHPDGSIKPYDLYADFGCSLGKNPSKDDPSLRELSVAIVPLIDGEFYHYGTSRELLSSTTALQNLVKDQRFIIQKDIKKQASVFTQNADVRIRFTEHNSNVWIENACLPETFRLSKMNIVTGLPENRWQTELPQGICLDVTPIGDEYYALRPYGFYDTFKGEVSSPATYYLGKPFGNWLKAHGFTPGNFGRNTDIQQARLFPLCRTTEEMERFFAWMIAEEPAEDRQRAYLTCPRVSAEDILCRANLTRLEAQRRRFQAENFKLLAANYRKSVFYQIDLSHAAHVFAEEKLPLPPLLDDEEPLLTRIQNAIFRAEVQQLGGEASEHDQDLAFSLLKEGITNALKTNAQPTLPRLDVCRDQIVWGRSPVRIDLAGGWTDTPPYSLINGGNVVNAAIELNGQPPLQVFVKPNDRPTIICRSIDLGASEEITTYEELHDYCRVNSPFSIPKAALALAGFSPEFVALQYPSLQEQLRAFGAGIEITLLSAIPAGSGLGTSSVLAATVLGALSDFCGLGWDKNEICRRTLVLEQLLTAGGGWQDQYGGILPGIKLLQSERGFNQCPVVSWLPQNLFEREYAACHLLYYTGVTRTAKNILKEIVRKMFLGRSELFTRLFEMKEHTLDLHTAIVKNDFARYGELIRKTWQQNKMLTSGTSPALIEQLTASVDDLCIGYKLPGAGGGGYLYMVAKDAEAAARIRHKLTEHPPTPSARFVEMTLSDTGFQISRS